MDHPTEKVIELALNAHRKEGGNLEDMNDFFRVIMGIPHPNKFGRNKFVRSLSTFIGTLQTSLSVVPNIPQPLAQLPRYVGTKRLFEAWGRFMLDPKKSRAEGAALGAFPLSVINRSIERGGALEGGSRIFRGVVAEVTGLRYISERNNSIAYEAFRLVMEDWHKHGLKGSRDINLAKQLGLTEEEINKAKKGDISDSTYRKFIQNGVARSQFTTESSYRKGKIENIPILNMLFAYSNYTLGNMRANIDWVSQVKEVVRNKDYKGAIRAVSDLSKLLIGSAGAGYAAMILRDAVKGQLSGIDDEDALDQLTTALTEVQLLGAAQRMMDPFKYSNGVMEKALISAMPHVQAISDAVGALLGMGRYGKLSLYDRTQRAFLRHAPLAKALGDPSFMSDPNWGWLDKLAWPEQIEYYDVRQKARKYEEDVLEKPRYVLLSQVNPEYQEVYELTKRFDFEGAYNEARAYYKEQYHEGVPVEKAIRKLRQSLLSRSPIPFRETTKEKFLFSMPAEERRTAIEIDRKYRDLVDLIAPK
jgi:hypothetical protein